jgi:transcriptional regulator with XRE-family HTH domain
MTATALGGRQIGAGRIVNATWFMGALAEAGLSQAEFARVAGVSASTVWKAANNRPLGPRTIRHLYKALRDLPPLPPEMLDGREPEHSVTEDLDAYMADLVGEGEPIWN